MSLFAYLMWFSTFISPLGIFYQDRENSGAKGTYLQNAKWQSKQGVWIIHGHIEL